MVHNMMSVCVQVCVLTYLECFYYLTRAVYSPASDLVKAVVGRFLGSWVAGFLGLSGHVQCLAEVMSATSVTSLF